MNSVNKPDIPLAYPIFDKEMENAALKALRTEKFVSGEEVYKFEEDFAHYCGVKYAVSMNSGTVALQLSLKALGIEGNLNKVITTPLSFIATTNSILHVNSVPIFADIDTKTCCIDPCEIQKKITHEVKAILPVHLYGYPSDMKKIAEIAQKNDLKIVEDACQAHGAEYYGHKVGSIGNVGCFSFYPSKNMTVCGDGGMVVTNDAEIAKTVGKLRDCGRKTKYEHDIVGYTARLNTVNAAIGRIQLKKLDEWNRKRRKKASLYNSLLKDIDQLILPPSEDSQIKPVYHLYVIRTKKRDELKQWLEHCGIQCGIHYPIPIHLQPVHKQLFGLESGTFPISELVTQTCLSIPLYPDLDEEKITYISDKIHEWYHKQ